MKVIIILFSFLTYCSLSLGRPAYQSRGWKPLGPTFNPSRSQYQRLPIRYGPPFDTATTTTTTTTTPRSREPTTPTITISEGSAPEDFESNPALAIANSFAFNRPIYVYNGFPLHPTYTILQQPFLSSPLGK